MLHHGLEPDNTHIPIYFPCIGLFWFNLLPTPLNSDVLGFENPSHSEFSMLVLTRVGMIIIWKHKVSVCPNMCYKTLCSFLSQLILFYWLSCFPIIILSFKKI